MNVCIITHTNPAYRAAPSPPPPPARQPLETIRLEITLGGPEDYEVNISDLAKATGQRPATPVPDAKRDTSDESDGDDEGDAKQPAAVETTTGKRRRKVRPSSLPTSSPCTSAAGLWGGATSPCVHRLA